MLKRQAFVGTMWLSIGNGLQLVVTLGTFLYLARVLSPSDFGAMALSAVLVDLLTNFGRFGQVEALMQRGVNDQNVRSTSFYLLLAIGIVFLVLIASVSSPLAAVTHSPQISAMLLLLCPVPLMQNLCQVNEAIARRAFRYRSISVRNITATICGGLCAVFLAAHGYGAMALAGQKFCFTAVYMVMMVASQRWLPTPVWSREALGHLWRTGWDFSINNTLFLANSRIVDLVTASFLGLGVLGMLRVSWRLYEFAVQIIVAPATSVAISSMTAVAHDPDARRNAYLTYSELLMIVTLPLFVGMSVLAHQLIVIAAGAKWAGSADLFALLAICAVPTCASLMFGPVMLALDRSADARRTAIWQTLTTAVFTLAAVPFGIRGVILGFMLRLAIFAVDNVFRMNRALDVPARTFLARVAPSFVTAGLMGLACFWLRNAVSHLGDVITLLVVGSAGAAIYVSVLLAGERVGLFPRFSGRLVRLGREIANKRGKSVSASN